MEINDIEIKEIPRLRQEHLDFIQSFGERHITQQSYDLYASSVSTIVFEQVLVEARSLDGKLIGLSLATRMGDNYTYGVNVVATEYRKNGIARLMAEKKLRIIGFEHNMPFVSQVHRTNLPAIKLMQKLGARTFVLNENFVMIWADDDDS